MDPTFYSTVSCFPQKQSRYKIRCLSKYIRTKLRSECRLSGALRSLMSRAGRSQCVGKGMNLTESQTNAIHHGDSNLQLIACAGSGKTEVVAQRVANLIKKIGRASCRERV